MRVSTSASRQGCADNQRNLIFLFQIHMVNDLTRAPKRVHLYRELTEMTREIPIPAQVISLQLHLAVGPVPFYQTPQATAWLAMRSSAFTKPE